MRGRQGRRRGRKPELLEVWRHLVGGLGGEVELTAKGKPRRAYIPHRNWTIVLDIYTVSSGTTSSTYTRIRALFVRDGGFTLRVTRRNPFHALAPLFRWGGVQVGYGQLDRALFVRSDRPEVARAALRGTSLGQRLIRDPRLKLLVTRPGKRIRKIAGDTVGEVQLLAGGQLRDLARLRGLVEVVMATLDELERLGPALPDSVPNVEI